MDRRQFVRLLGATALSGAVPGCGGGSSSPADVQTGNPPLPPPAVLPFARNVIFISIDDLNDWVGVLDTYPGVQTPNIDRLAAGGQLFTRAYCTAPSCNASRTSVLTGLQPFSTGVYRSEHKMRQLVPGATTLPEYMALNGFRTEGAGKVFHHPDDQSWHNFQLKSADPLPPSSPRSASGIPCSGEGAINPAFYFDWAPLNVADREMADADVAAFAEGFLSVPGRADPFFLGLGFFRPHIAWYVPSQYFDMYPLDTVVLPNVNANDLDDIPPIASDLHAASNEHHSCITGSGNWKNAVQAYLASITFTDTMLGRILKALDNSEYAANTAIVLWSDHGFHLGEKLHWQKRALWEESTRVPLIIKAPGVTTPGAVCDSPVSLIDLYPTILELFGLPPLASLEGESIVRLLRDSTAERRAPPLTTLDEGNHAVRNSRWRYIRYSDGSEELYDHESDPAEWTNVAGEPRYDAVKQELAKWLPIGPSSGHHQGEA